jgi:hypothetical protein
MYWYRLQIKWDLKKSFKSHIGSRRYETWKRNDAEAALEWTSRCLFMLSQRGEAKWASASVERTEYHGGFSLTCQWMCHSGTGTRDCKEPLYYTSLPECIHRRGLARYDTSLAMRAIQNASCYSMNSWKAAVLYVAILKRSFIRSVASCPRE